MTWYDTASRDAERLLPILSAPSSLVVCGSGARELPELLGKVEATVDVSSISSWPHPSAAGHGSTIAAVRVEDRLVWVATGRVHFYDDLGINACAHAVRVAHLAGATRVVLTNAAGSLDQALQPGSVVAIEDHVNLIPSSPLSGPQPDGYQRFVPLDGCYDSRLLECVRPLVDGVGVYAALPGPSYETRAEIRMLAGFGCTLVGMSTVPEALAARQASLEVAAFSVVSNMATGISESAHDHNEVLAQVAAATPRLASAVRAAILR